MFPKKSAPQAKPVAGHSSASGSTFSVLGADTAIKGDIAASADLHIDGKVEGDIVCAGLVQGETSEIIGGVSADTARLAGQVQGSISARDLVILKTARVRGDVEYDALTIEQGAQVDGRLSPRGAQMPEGLPEDGAEKHLILASSSE